MASVAEQLREARERQKLSVYDVAEATKIRTDHIRALEDGNYDTFAAPVYIRGFVRNYASLLKLNVPEVLKSLDGELATTKKFSEPPSLSPQSQGLLDELMLQLAKVNWPLTLLVGLGAILLVSGFIGYQVWQRQRAIDPLAGLRPLMYQPKDTNSAETLPLPAPPGPK